MESDRGVGDVSVPFSTTIGTSHRLLGISESNISEVQAFGLQVRSDGSPDSQYGTNGLVIGSPLGRNLSGPIVLMDAGDPDRVAFSLNTFDWQTGMGAFELHVLDASLAPRTDFGLGGKVVLYSFVVSASAGMMNHRALRDPSGVFFLGFTDTTKIPWRIAIHCVNSDGKP